MGEWPLPFNRNYYCPTCDGIHISERHAYMAGLLLYDGGHLEKLDMLDVESRKMLALEPCHDPADI